MTVMLFMIVMLCLQVVMCDEEEDPCGAGGGCVPLTAAVMCL